MGHSNMSIKGTFYFSRNSIFRDLRFNELLCDDENALKMETVPIFCITIV